MTNASSFKDGWWAFGAALVLYLVAVRPFYGVTADDAFISFRYAQNWAAGCGPVYSCGEAPVEGYTNFLWVAISALAIASGLNVVVAMRLLGLVCGFAAVAAALLLIRRLYVRRSSQLVLLAGLASSPFWAANAPIGLETAAATLSVVLAALLSLDLVEGRRPWPAGLAWGVAYLLRPEALGFAAFTGLWYLGWGLARSRSTGAGSWRAVLRGALIYGASFLLVGGPYFVWRVLYYGDLFPNTFHAKREALDVLVPRNLGLLGEHWLYFVPVVLVALVVVVVQRRREQLYLVILALIAAAISISVHNNFWMPGHRLYLTAVALLLVVAGGVVDLPSPPTRQRWIGPLLLGLTCAVLALASWRYFPPTQELSQLHYAQDDNPARRMGLMIRTMARPGDWLAIRDAGMVPFFAGPRVKVLDMHEKSLNDRHITRDGLSVKYVMRHRPRFIVFVSPFQGEFPIHTQYCQLQGIRVSDLLDRPDKKHCVVMAHLQELLIARSSQFRKAGYHKAMQVSWHRLRHFLLFRRD